MTYQKFLITLITLLSFALMLTSSFVEGGLRENVLSKFYNDASSTTNNNGTKWALLIAGSNDYMNYRHQADVCHAYHVLKEGGLKDENIIVFMYDDIAYNPENPRPGVIINRPNGPNLYPGVPKDYTGKHVTASNFYAAILGNKKGIKGGSGKVLNTKPNDHIFIYYTDHGGVGLLGMPDDEKTIYAIDFVNVLKKKHEFKSYKSMVIYIEACESGSIFDGLLPKNLSIYVITASKPHEGSYACYCDIDSPPQLINNPYVYYKYDVCLGDLYSVSWMEDSDKCDLTRETLEQQYMKVHRRTNGSSHTMQYGDVKMSKQFVANYMGTKSSTKKKKCDTIYANYQTPFLNVIKQRDADLFYLQQKVKRSEEGSNERIEAQKNLEEEISHRKHVDQSIVLIVQRLFGQVNGQTLTKSIRPSGQPLVDDWDCFKSMVDTYEEYCGPLRNYGRKHSRVFANMCNAGRDPDEVAQAAVQVCAKHVNQF